MPLVTFITHSAFGWFAAAIVGLLAVRRSGSTRRSRRFLALALFLPAMPDLDVIGFAFGIPYGSILGHRGITHSIPFAALTGLLAALLCRRSDAEFSGGFSGLAFFFFAVTASHGLFDAMTHWPDGSEGMGIAFFAPFSGERFFLPWRPIPVSPIGRHFLSHGGLRVLATETAWLTLPFMILFVLLRISRSARVRDEEPKEG